MAKNKNILGLSDEEIEKNQKEQIEESKNYPWNLKVCTEETEKEIDVKWPPNVKESAKSITSICFCEWKKYDVGSMGCEYFVTNIQCNNLEIAEDNISYSFAKKHFRYCPFCGKIIKYIN